MDLRSNSRGTELDMAEEQPILSVGRVFRNEAFLRELVLFGILFGALILQSWDNLLLLLFPILLCGEAIFFRAFQLGQEINYSGFTSPFETLGINKKAADRLEFAGYLTLLVVIIQGYDSLVRPQLVSNLAPYFLEILMATYLLGNYWIFSNLQSGQSYSPKEYGGRSIEGELEFPRGNRPSQAKSVLLKVASYSSILSLAVFAVGTLFNILAFFALTPALLVDAPGSILLNGTPIPVSGAFIVVLVIPPLYAILGTWSILAKTPLPEAFFHLKRVQVEHL